MFRRFSLAAISVVSLSGSVAAQAQPADTGPLNVFLDCQAQNCDSNHFRTEISFVNWVRDRTASDVHVLITGQETGGGGVMYALSFFGQRAFASDTLELSLTTAQSATSAERRDVLTNRIAQGLLRYAIHTPGIDRVGVKSPSADDDDEDGGGAPAPGGIDPWKHWVFSTGIEANADGEQRQASKKLHMAFDAARITEIWKYQLRIQGSYTQDRYDLNDGKFVVVRRNYSTGTQLTKALAPQWSAGLQAEAGTSTFRNQDLYARLAPLLEYSFFPYSEFSRRRVTLQYSLGVNHFDYKEETLFDKRKEQVADEALQLAVRYQQPWGSSNLELEGSHYFHDLSRYSLGAEGGIDIRIARGLEFEVGASYSRVHNQLYIQKGDASDEDVLTERLALATGYEYELGIGLRYTFGSIFNNIINRRIQ